MIGHTNAIFQGRYQMFEHKFFSNNFDEPY